MRSASKFGAAPTPAAPLSTATGRPRKNRWGAGVLGAAAAPAAAGGGGDGFAGNGNGSGIDAASSAAAAGLVAAAAAASSAGKAAGGAEGEGGLGKRSRGFSEGGTSAVFWGACVRKPGGIQQSRVCKDRIGGCSACGNDVNDTHKSSRVKTRQDKMAQLLGGRVLCTRWTCAGREVRLLALVSGKNHRSRTHTKRQTQNIFSSLISRLPPDSLLPLFPHFAAP